MSDFPEFIRVRWSDSGTEQTIARPAAIDKKAFVVLDEDATDVNGQPLPPKLPAKKSGQKAATEKES